MKHFTFLVTFFFIGSAIYAQDSSINLKKLETFNLPDFRIKKIPFKYAEKLGTNNLSTGKTFHKPGVSILSLDNMPCFVPDVAVVSKMPNQQSNGSAVRIPNKITIIEVKEAVS